jgi:hypothetical protein
LINWFANGDIGNQQTVIESQSKRLLGNHSLSEGLQFRYISALPVIAPIPQAASLEIVTAAQPLSPDEKSRLKALELTVERNLTGFIAAGRALLTIREEKLWRGRYASFAEYCRERFGLCRSTADQLCRSTQVFETLNVCLAGPDAPVSNTPEVVLRPLTTLPSPELQVQTWRLAASVSPDGKPTRTIAARVCGLVRKAIQGSTPAKKDTVKDRDPMFTRPVLRLSKIRSFRPDLACLHVKTPEQAGRISEACTVVAQRCIAIQAQLAKNFPDAHLTGQTH